MSDNNKSFTKDDIFDFLNQYIPILSNQNENIEISNKEFKKIKKYFKEILKKKLTTIERLQVSQKYSSYFDSKPRNDLDEKINKYVKDFIIWKIKFDIETEKLYTGIYLEVAFEKVDKAFSKLKKN